MSERPTSVSRAVLPALLALTAAACGGGGGGGSSSPSSSGMSIVTCSLGCHDSIVNPGDELTCTVTDIEVNREIRVTFSNPIDPLSVTPSTFILTDTAGQTPPGSFSIDPNDERVLIYRPLLTFDSSGNATVGLRTDEEYALHVPGARLDLGAGTFIRSKSGTRNQNRLQCRVRASQGIIDSRPGRPNVTITLDTVAQRDVDGNPIAFNFGVPAANAVDAFRNTAVRMVFNDVMNPATLANPVTRTSTTIRFLLDADGDTTNPNDRVELGGTYTLSFDQAALTTTVTFLPSDGFPSGGHGVRPRRVLIEFQAQIEDLGGNRLVNPGLVVFTPEIIDFAPLVASESFGDSLFEDSLRTGSRWGGGVLSTGPGGGSGRLGDLVVLPGQAIELDTDFEDFAGLNTINFNPANVIDRTGPVTVDDGIFEFSRLRVDAGGVLRFRGSRPARVYVRGEAIVQGVLDLSGESAILQVSSALAGGDESVPGAGGGVGGHGGSRPDGQLLAASGGLANPPAGPTDVLDPATYTFVNGGAGGGLPIPNAVLPTGFAAGGGAGLAWPQPTASRPDLHLPASPSDISGLDLYPLSCSVLVPGAPGGGGGYAFSGTDGRLISANFGGFSIARPPQTLGGDAGPLALGPLARSLAPEFGFLRGGGGGGGGGAHIQESVTNGVPGDCSVVIGTPPARVRDTNGYITHSAAAGGAGGGALQLTAGRRINLIGSINASGGNGGNGTYPPRQADPPDLAQAGGGGAGGAVLLQSQTLQIQAVPGRINVAGGLGGEGVGAQLFIAGVPVSVPSTGGRGSPGLVRLEGLPAPVLDTEETKITPRESALQAQFGSGAVIEDIVSTATWTPRADSPSGRSGAQSCWIRPAGSFFELEFAADGAEPGWDLLLRISGQAQAQSLRGPNDITPGMTLEDIFGNDLGTAPVIVRFQGARALRRLTDPCSVVEVGSDSPLVAGSVTDWVRHPAELNDFHGRADLTPNVFRFVVIWDRSSPAFSAIQGAEALQVKIQPE